MSSPPDRSAPMLERLARHPESFPGSLLLVGSSEARLQNEALRLAAALLCPGGDPENRCDACRRVFAGLHPDFLPVDPDGVQIRIDRVREAILFGAGRPYEAARRVCRVARADLLGLPAANALLKSLEEPGSHLHWILTTSRPETLLPTIRSRCVVAPVAAPAFAGRVEQWRSRGRTPEDAEDLARLCGEPEEAAEELAAARELRSQIIGALRSGLVGGDLFPLLLLAENLARVDRSSSRLLSELLADGAVLAAGGSGEFLRHRPPAGPLSEIAQRIGSGPLREAAALAADEPPDNRFGNRRLHFEAVLLGLFRAAAG